MMRLNPKPDQDSNLATGPALAALKLYRRKGSVATPGGPLSNTFFRFIALDIHQLIILSHQISSLCVDIFSPPLSTNYLPPPTHPVNVFKNGTTTLLKRHFRFGRRAKVRKVTNACPNPGGKKKRERRASKK